MCSKTGGLTHADVGVPVEGHVLVDLVHDGQGVPLNAQRPQLLQLRPGKHLPEE